MKKNYFMNLFAISGLLIGFTGILEALLVFLKSQNRIQYLWGTFCLSFTLWGIGAYKVATATDPTSAIFWWKFAYVGVIFIPIFLVHFIYEFIGIKSKWFTPIVYGLGVLFLLTNILTDLFINQVNFVFNQFYYISSPTYLYSAFVIFFLALVAISIFKLWQYSQKARGIKRIQLKYIVISMLVGFSGGSFSFLPVYQIYLYPFLNLLVPVGIVMVAYAIFRYRFIDLRVLARQIFIYFSLAVLAYLVFYLIAWIYLEFLGGIFTPRSYLVGLAIAPIFILLVYKSESLLKKVANKYFFFSLYNYQESISRLSSQLTYHTDLDEINELITKTIQEIMGIKKVEVKLINPKVRTKDSLTRYLDKTQRPIILEELYLLSTDDHLKDQHDEFQLIIDQMERSGASVCLPLVSNKRLIGSIILGSKLFSDPFTSEDLELLVSLSSQAGIAIDNAELYKEVKDFNKTLKQKVNEQTMSLQDKTKVLEEQAEHLKKLLAMRSEFLDIASHQLKTPISVISGTISMFKEGSVQKMPIETQNKLIDNIYQKSLKISQIIRDILQASEFDTEKFSFVEKKIVPVDLNKMLAEIVIDNQAFANEKKLQLIFTPNPVNPQVNSDPDYLEQAIANLVDNALKYTKEGKVEVALDENPQSIIIKVKDTGVGIPKDDQTRMFGKFERAKNAVDMYTDGSGLGLFITKEIIEAHPGGTITFTSEEGKGTEFIITIPKTKK